MDAKILELDLDAAVRVLFFPPEPCLAKMYSR